MKSFPKPQLRTSFSRKLLGTTLALSVLTTSCSGQKKEAAAPPAIPVKLQALAASTVVNSTNYVGTLVARERVELSPQIQGRILSIFVNEGATVTRGTPIFLLEPLKQQEDVNAAVGNLNVQRATLSNTEASLRATQASRDASVSGVANSRANLANAEETLKQRDADLRKEQANLELATVNLERSKFLVKEGVRPQQDLDDKTRDIETAKANVDSASKVRDASKASRDAAKAALDQTIQNLKGAEEQVVASRADVDRQKAAISQAQGQLGSVNQDLLFNRVLAPIDGTVGSFDPRKVGDMVNVGEVVTTITNNQVFDLNIFIPTEYRDQLRTGIPVEVVKSDGSIGVRGQITFIASQVDPATQAIKTKVTFTNDGSLRDRQYVQVRVIWSRKPGVLIPTTAVTSLGAQKFVFVAEQGESKEGKSNLVVKQKPVQIGNIQGQAYQVISGVKAGDRIAVSQILNLRDGIPITEQQSGARSQES